MRLFSDFSLSKEVLTALQKMGYREPSTIQQQAIPLIQEGHDLIALAETGSGKTAACAIPICDRVDVSRRVIQALIVVPTRELAVQYATETAKIGRIKDVGVISVVGGEGYDLQKAKLKHGVHVCVATPGRLIDYIYSRDIDLSEVETVILDEADEMLSMGFYDDLEFIINCLVHDHQTLLFSATMPADIKKIAAGYMKDPREVVLTAKKAAPSQIDHKFVYCRPDERVRRLRDVIGELTPSPRQSIVFCESRRDCEKVCRELKQWYKGVDYLHAGLPQEIRNVVMSKFRSGRVKMLVATDVAARGLDFKEITHIFNFQLPREPEIYIHRSGRTGRYGREGTAISFVTRREMHMLNRILHRLKKEPNWIGEGPSDPGRERERPPPRPRRRQK